LAATGEEHQPGINGAIIERTSLTSFTTNTINVSSVDEYAATLPALRLATGLYRRNSTATGIMPSESAIACCQAPGRSACRDFARLPRQYIYVNQDPRCKESEKNVGREKGSLKVHISLVSDCIM